MEEKEDRERNSHEGWKGEERGCGSDRSGAKKRSGCAS